MKKKSWIIIIALVLVLLGVGVFAYFNNPNRLTASEQRWIYDNNTNIQNINVIIIPILQILFHFDTKTRPCCFINTIHNAILLAKNI